MEKSYTLSFLDHSADGWVSCKENENGFPYIAYRIPHDKYNEHKDFPDEDNMKKPGIYFLVGKGDKKGDKNLAYIGRTGDRFINDETFRTRLKEHEKDKWKDKWDYVLIVTKTDEDLDDRELKYLESRFIKYAKEADVYSINQNNENEGKPGDSKDRMDKLIDITKNYLYILGNDIYGVGISKIREEKVQAVAEKQKVNKTKETTNSKSEDQKWHKFSEIGNPSFSNPLSIKILGKEEPIKSWVDVLQKVFEYLYRCDSDKMLNYAMNNYKKTDKPNAVVYITNIEEEAKKMRQKRHLLDTNITINTHGDADALVKFVGDFLKKFRVSNSDIEIYY